MAQALEFTGHIEEAITAYRRAIKIEWGRPRVLRRLALLLATHPESRYRDGVEAMRLMVQARQSSSPDSPAILDTLAAVFAENGLFERAVAASELALKQARNMNVPQEQWESLLQRLELYRQNHPYRRDPTLAPTSNGR